MSAIKLLALCLVTGCAFATWATCEPPQTEPSPYKPLQLKRDCLQPGQILNFIRSLGSQRHRHIARQGFMGC